MFDKGMLQLILKREDEAAFHLQRWKAAFPDSYAEWKAGLVEKAAD